MNRRCRQAIMDRPTSSSRVAIIGAGPCGLSQLHSFARAEAAGVEIPEIVCFEKQDDLGGMWNLSWRTGLDEFGEPVHSGMYRNLWINAPKECYEFADYTFDKHFSKPMPSYLTRQHFRDYIVGRATESNLKRYIRFNCAVRMVDFDDANNHFIVQTEDLKSGKNHLYFFDYIIVATGHFSTPHLPHFEGLERFPGRILHSHDFRDGKQFAGLNLLVIGGSYSAEDIALQSYKYGANSVVISYRTKPMGFKWPNKIEELALVQRIDENKIAYFSDGSQRQVDVIILCTGYLHYFPFIVDKLRLVTKNRYYPKQLYKGIFFQDQPRMMYLGMQDLFFTTTLFDIQAWYARDVILKRIRLPEHDERAADIAVWLQRESQLTNPFQTIDFQASYMEELSSFTDYPPLDIKQTAHLLKQWEHDKEEDILTFRNKIFSSVITGSKGIAPSKLWVDAKID